MKTWGARMESLGLPRASTSPQTSRVSENPSDEEEKKDHPRNTWSFHWSKSEELLGKRRSRGMASSHAKTGSYWRVSASLTFAPGSLLVSFRSCPCQALHESPEAPEGNGFPAALQMAQAASVNHWTRRRRREGKAWGLIQLWEPLAQVPGACQLYLQ